MLNQSFKRAKIEVENEVENKLKSTLAISITISKNPNIAKIFQGKKEFLSNIENLPQLYRKYTKYKNIWIELFDKNNYVVYRSWTQKYGDSLIGYKEELETLLKGSKHISTISVNKFTMGIQAMSPVYDHNRLLGFIEIISHFNSIVKNLQKYGYETLIVADK